MKKPTTEEWIVKARQVHGNKYDYSKVEYVDAKTKVCIICQEHSEFWQTPDSHLRGSGCPKCGRDNTTQKQSSTTKKFIEKAKKIHGDVYDYSKVDYVNNREKVCVVCPIHGEFKQAPNKHLSGRGCHFCKNNKIGNALRKSKEKFIKQSKIVHGDVYDYSKVCYTNDRIKVIIICPVHGEFEQAPTHHLRGSGCSKCGDIRGGLKNVSNTEEFIEKVNLVHRGKYDYSKVEYVDAKAKVCIICSEHGEFWMTPNNHLRGKGCKECGVINSKIKQTPTTEEFIEKAKQVHGDRYDYSKVDYENARRKVIIVCPIHGEFKQTPDGHLNRGGQGCSICSESKLEKETVKLLKQYGIRYERQKKFDWLRHKKALSLDFYLPEYNIAIECQGIQHFESIRFGGITIEKANQNLKYLQNSDRIKKQLCEKNNLPLHYINYNDNVEEELNEILKQRGKLHNKYTT